jgi:hypothetical protein
MTRSVALFMFLCILKKLPNERDKIMKKIFEVFLDSFKYIVGFYCGPEIHFFISQ